MSNPTFRCKNCRKEINHQDNTCLFCGADLTKGRFITFDPFAPMRSPDEVSYALSTVKKEILTHFDKYKNSAVQHEADVTFILSDVRKILERYKKSKDQKEIKFYLRYKTLNFYCNWALHTEIDREDKVTELLKEIDIKVGEFIKNFSQENYVELSRSLSRFASLYEMNSLLREFFAEYGFSLLTINRHDEWKKFWSLFLKLVVDSELKTKKDLHNIEGIVITRVKHTSIHKDAWVEISLPSYEDLGGEISIIVKFINGDQFSLDMPF